MTGTKCRGICDRPDNDFVKSSSYQDGKLNFCAICMVFIVKKHIKCPCCRLKLRTKPKATKDRRSKEGDDALTYFDLAIMRTNDDFKALRKCYKLPALGHNIIDNIFSRYHEVLRQYERIEEEKRQRPEYLQAKMKKMQKLIEKIRRETTKFNREAVYS